MFKELRVMLPKPRCNMACKYCLNSYGADKDAADFGYDPKMLLEAIQAYSFPRISLWGGEPLIDLKALGEILEFLRKNYDKPISMLSNGSLLTDEAVELLNHYDAELSISHDGPAQRFRGKDMLKEPGYLKRLARVKKFNGFNCVVHRYNMDAKAVISYFDALNLPGDDWQVTFEPYELTDDRLLEFLPQGADLAALGQGYLDRIEAALSGHKRLRAEARRIKLAMEKRGPGLRCGANNRLTVTCSGQVYFCQVCAEGNNSAWYGLELPAMCEGCIHAQACHGICPCLPDRYRKKLCMTYHLWYDAIKEGVARHDRG